MKSVKSSIRVPHSLCTRARTGAVRGSGATKEPRRNRDSESPTSPTPPTERTWTRAEDTPQ